MELNAKAVSGNAVYKITFIQNKGSANESHFAALRETLLPLNRDTFCTEYAGVTPHAGYICLFVE